jgi:C-terminal processing protease CtpA/Prc
MYGAEPALTSIDGSVAAVLPRVGALRGAGYECVARLGGRIGYIELHGFRGDLRRLAAVTDEVMDGLRDADALIIDLRRYRGGRRAAAALVASFLFDTQPMYFDAVYWGQESRARPIRIVPRSTGARYLERPVLVLTSACTSPVGIELAGALQALGRALVVGEVPLAGRDGEPRPVADIPVPAGEALRVAAVVAGRG